LSIYNKIKQAAGDVADSIAIRIINSRIENYGAVQSLKINRVLHEIDISLTLHGEKDLVHVICRKYSFHVMEEKIYAKVESFTSCRPWLNAILNDFATKKLFPLNHPQAKMIPVYFGYDVQDGKKRRQDACQNSPQAISNPECGLI